MRNISDRTFGIAGLLLAALIFWRASIIEESFIQDPLGPKAFPYVIATVLALASAFIVARPDPEPDWPRLGRVIEILFAVAVMVAYAQLLPVAGFVAATSVAAAYLCWRLSTPPVWALVAGITIAVGIYVVFHLILGLSLARGPWGF
ncbi:MAG: membrane protein [Alphaproteobacteria bacterium]|nr:MAG: membrane protein [Alphaproteobacteria bacterium]